MLNKEWSHAGDKTYKWGNPQIVCDEFSSWFWHPGQTQQDVKNIGIIGPTKGLMSSSFKRILSME